MNIELLYASGKDALKSRFQTSVARFNKPIEQMSVNRHMQTRGEFYLEHIALLFFQGF